MSTPHQILKQYWGFETFRPIQEEIIESILAGKDTLALLPTGGGKSICFQIPAMVNKGICLVISPLIALMKDQVENLHKRNIPALFIHSGMSFYEVKQTLQNAAYGHYKFLYVSPERLETDLFKEYLPALNINLIAVDEAHCISQWGYDFRPPYLRISKLRQEVTAVAVLALTASATPLVQNDICEKLLFKEKLIFRQSFEKPNLSFSVFKVDSKVNKLIDILEKVPGCAIVYCRNRKLTKETAHLLNLSNISADYYHAGLTQQQRNDKQESWIQNRTRVIVCTNAFGMGIDKPDVRSVIHFDIPDNLENYYQEAGRAGRDGLRSFAVLLYTEPELDALAKLPEIKYPPTAEIRKVYQALSNFLQLPVGSGEGTYFDFNLLEFVKLFKFDNLLVVNSLKALEQDGHLSFNEQIFIPAKVCFTCDKDTLQQFEISHPELENLIKYLLRTYEGIFDNVVSVNEQLISRLTKINKEELQAQLRHLQAFDIIEYHPQKETPQIYFLQNRAPAEHLVFNHRLHLERKKQYRLRISTMMGYVKLERQCRSEFIGKYFGDTNMKRCGACDNCIQQKSVQLTSEEFLSISDKITEHVTGTGIDVKELLNQLKGIRKEKVWKVLDYLQAERKLRLNKEGLIVKAVH
jgi:ATP-dependent DNA helicase RecQ